MINTSPKFINLLDLDLTQPQIMAVLNITPDSFSDGGRFFEGGKLQLNKVQDQAALAIEQGASILDIGGESTRPGAKLISSAEEIDRVLPVLEKLQHLALTSAAVISLDTSNPELMKLASSYGVGLINDVRALQREGALLAAAVSGLPVCLMHMQGQPQTMQDKPDYQQLLVEVSDFLSQRIATCQAAGIAKNQLILDPGFGFGKTLSHNLLLLQQLSQLTKLGLPLLVGFSRKSMIAHALGERATEQRLSASLALAVMALERGARIFRVHDVQQSADAINMAWQVLQEGSL